MTSILFGRGDCVIIMGWFLFWRCILNYRTCAIITHSFWSLKIFFQDAFFLKFLPYVWLVFQSGLFSRAGYDGACMVYIPYAHHHKPLLSRSRSWIQAIHKDIIFWTKLLKNKEMVFGNGVKNIQAVAYNGARMVTIFVFFHFY